MTKKKNIKKEAIKKMIYVLPKQNLEIHKCADNYYSKIAESYKVKL